MVVVVVEIVPEGRLHLGLLDPVDRERERRLMAVLDKLNGRFGREREELEAEVRAEAPCYTTRLSDLPVVRV